jgi:hypothetical protein
MSKTIAVSEAETIVMPGAALPPSQPLSTLYLPSIGSHVAACPLAVGVTLNAAAAARPSAAAATTQNNRFIPHPFVVFSPVSA